MARKISEPKLSSYKVHKLVFNDAAVTTDVGTYKHRREDLEKAFSAGRIDTRMDAAEKIILRAGIGRPTYQEYASIPLIPLLWLYVMGNEKGENDALYVNLIQHIEKAYTANTQFGSRVPMTEWPASRDFVRSMSAVKTSVASNPYNVYYGTLHNLISCLAIASYRSQDYLNKNGGAHVIMESMLSSFFPAILGMRIIDPRVAYGKCPNEPVNASEASPIPGDIESSGPFTVCVNDTRTEIEVFYTSYLKSLVTQIRALVYRAGCKSREQGKDRVVTGSRMSISDIVYNLYASLHGTRDANLRLSKEHCVWYSNNCIFR